MAIKHMVLLSFKPSLSTSDIKAVKNSLADLKHVIPQIMSFSWCENNSLENLHHGYLHGFVMEFKNTGDRAHYLSHPEHIRIAQEVILPKLANGMDSVIVFDYEF